MAESAPVPIAEELAAHVGFLRRLSRRLVFDPDQADELVQQAVVAALKSRTTPQKGLRPWLFGVMRNLNRMRFRSERRRADHESKAPPPRPEPGPDDLASRLEVQAILAAEVRGLREPYRRTIYLRFYEGLTSEEIAARVGAPSPTVRTRLRRGLAMLRERLDHRHGGDRRAWAMLLAPLALGGGGAVPGAGGGELPTAPAATAGLKKLVALLLVAAAVGVGLWVRLGETGRPEARAPSREAPSPSTPVSGREGGGPAPRSQAEEPQQGLPPAVDLAAASREHDLCGTVVDPKGRPVAGASVAVLPRPFLELGGRDFKAGFSVRPERECRTAADGTFLFRLGAGRMVHLRVTHGDLGEILVPRCQAGERIRVVLGPGADLEVAVTDEEGRPVEGAALWLYRGTFEGDSPVVRRGTSGADGNHMFAGLTPGEALLFVEHPRLGTVGWRSPVIPAAGVEACHVTLPSGREVRGRVLDAATGAPIGGAVLGEGPVYFRPVRSGPDGRFVFPGWSGQMERIYCSAEGYGFAWLEVGAGEDLEFRLLPGGAVRGRVVDATGRPVGGAGVAVMAPRLPVHHVVRATADSDGRFAVGGLRSDLPLTLRVEAPGCGTLWRELPSGGGSILDEDLGEVRLPRPARLAGSVAGPDGVPVARARVALAALGAGEAADDWKAYRCTDDLGRFLYPDLGPGRYRVVVSVEGTLPVFREVVVGLGASDEPIEFELGGGGRLRVLVIDGSGTPIAGASVECVLRQGRVSARTAGDGRAVIEGLSDEEVTVTVSVASAPGGRHFLPKSIGPVSPEDGEVEVVLNPAAAVRGRVLDPDGQPLSGMQVHAVGPGAAAPVAVAVTDEAGDFLLRVPVEGRVDLLVGGQRFPGGFDREAEETGFRGEVRGVLPSASEVTIRTHRTDCYRTLTVLALDPDGKPLPGVEAIVNSQAAFRWIHRETDESGRARFSGLSAEDLRVFVTRGDSAAARSFSNPSMVRVVPEGQEIAMRFERGAPIRGRVIGGDGVPLVGATVDLALDGPDGGGSYLERTVTDEEGRFVVNGRRGARHRLGARWRDPDGRWHHGSMRNVLPNDLEVVFPVDVGPR